MSVAVGRQKKERSYHGALQRPGLRIIIAVLGNHQGFVRSSMLRLLMGVQEQSRIVLRGDIFPDCVDAILLHRPT